MEQLSLFDMNLGQEILATCIWKYEEEGKKTEPIDDWMRKLVPDGEYAVMIGEHPDGVTAHDAEAGRGSEGAGVHALHGRRCGVLRHICGPCERPRKK